MRIFVAGGTGVVGRPLVRTLVEAGHEVTATTHRGTALPVVEASGARAVVMDGLDEASVRRAVLEARPQVIINQITSLSAPADDYASWLVVTNKLRVRGTKALLDAAREARTHRVVGQSASFMTEPAGAGHGPSISDPTDESAALYLQGPGALGSHARANSVAEAAMLGTVGVEGVVLRYGFLYGPGTAIGPGGDIAVGVQAGEIPIVGEGAGRYPFLHVRDAVTAAVQAVDQAEPGVYNIVDNEPAAQADWVPYLAGLLGAPGPRHISEAEAEARIGVQAIYYGNRLRAASNEKAMTRMGLKLEFPSWRDGFRDVFE